MESILLESATAFATANIGNPLLVVSPPAHAGGSSPSGAAAAAAGAAAASKDWDMPVAGGEGMFSYHRAA